MGNERVYQRTKVGIAAWRDAKSGLSLPFRRILSLIEGNTHFTLIRSNMGACRDDQLAGWLEQLETLGFIQSESAANERNLDFNSLATRAAKVST